MSTYDLVAAVRGELAAIDGVKTCKIGIEANLTAADYPIVRIVPSLLKPDKQGLVSRSGIELLVYYGELAYDFKDGGIEAQYKWLLTTEQVIKDTLAASDVVRYEWIETVLDEDRIPGYKLFASRIKVTC